MLKFILNNQLIEASRPSGMTLLDFVRYEKQLAGTKIGCREGDCGACTLLVGELINGKVQYNTLTSCISPLINAHGKHIVSIEGLNMNELTPVQKAMVDESGSQCGFCTVGFIVSLVAECLSYEKTSYDNLISAIDGNICRCTGYKSIERACQNIYNKLLDKDLDDTVKWCISNNFVPAYFENISSRLENILSCSSSHGELIVVGGTDLMVQKQDEVYESDINAISDNKRLTSIRINGTECFIGAKTTVSQLMQSSELLNIFPKLYQHLKLVASTPIRNMGTIGGNLVNASPIGDLTVFFLALNSSISIENTKKEKRIILLSDFFKGYKTIDLENGEYISQLHFTIPNKNTYFNFEKVSKRTYLDIASVNSAMSITLNNNIISDVHVSAGGVAPVPKYLTKTCNFLTGKRLSSKTVNESLNILQQEISPISDARGSEAYKRLLLRQLFWAHFMELFSDKFELNALQVQV